MGIDILIGALVLLLGGSSYTAIREHGQLADAHKQAVAQKATIEQLKAAEVAQNAAQAREDADRKQRDADMARQAQIRGTYHVATSQALKATPPDVPAALSFNSLAIGADDPLSAITQATGEALAAANAARQAQLIADLQAQLAEVKADRDQKAVAIAADVKDKIAATGQIAQLTGVVETKSNQIADVTAAKKEVLDRFALLTAKYGQWVFWSIVAGVIVFILAHVGLFTHLSTVKQLHVVTTAHAAAQTTIAAQAATIDAHVATIKTLASTP